MTSLSSLFKTYRTNISFDVSTVSQFMHAPRPKHMKADFRILRYLKGSPGQGLYKNHGHQHVQAYINVDRARRITNQKSTSGEHNCTFIGGNLVSWRSKKQSVVARSSAEAEFRAMAHEICDVF
uniref:Mitochondrial protein n=1 Tax=Cajanus cajan TaxID=3821 RepID=A0A151RNQ4_CAJCA|nr:hypothetical protein KK1_034328 [Cajanus cajan]